VACGTVTTFFRPLARIPLDTDLPLRERIRPDWATRMEVAAGRGRVRVGRLAALGLVLARERALREPWNRIEEHPRVGVLRS
jgi:hypothetical protein